MPVSRHCHSLVAVGLLISNSGAFILKSQDGSRIRQRSSTSKTTSLRVLGDIEQGLDTENEEPERPFVGQGGAFDIFDLLLQRSIQTSVYHYKDTRNNLKADWLIGFLGHNHLDEGTRWHSIIGMRAYHADYLRALLNEPIREITVQYGGDNQLAQDSASAATPLGEEPAGAHPDLMGWSKAAASRRRNPYLNKPKVFEYVEILDPGQLGENLMAVTSQLASEFEQDLLLLSKLDNQEERLAARQEAKKVQRAKRVRCRADPDLDECSLENMYDGPETPAFVNAERSRSGDSTPLRRLNFELLQRAATLQSIKALQAELALGAMKGQFGGPKKRRDMGSAQAAQDAADLDWLDAFLDAGPPQPEAPPPGSEEMLSGGGLDSVVPTVKPSSDSGGRGSGWLDALAEVTTSLIRRDDKTDVALDTVSDRLLAGMDFLPPTQRGNLLVDPAGLANRIREHREQATLRMATSVAQCDAVLDQIRIRSEERMRLERSVMKELEEHVEEEKCHHGELPWNHGEVPW